MCVLSVALSTGFSVRGVLDSRFLEQDGWELLEVGKYGGFEGRTRRSVTRSSEQKKKKQKYNGNLPVLSPGVHQTSAPCHSQKSTFRALHT